jgi:hypothetical protein
MRSDRSWPMRGLPVENNAGRVWETHKIDVYDKMRDAEVRKRVQPCLKTLPPAKTILLRATAEEPLSLRTYIATRSTHCSKFRFFQSTPSKSGWLACRAAAHPFWWSRTGAATKYDGITHVAKSGPCLPSALKRSCTRASCAVSLLRRVHAVAV